MRIEIRSVNNGFILTSFYEEKQKDYMVKLESSDQFVCEDSDDDEHVLMTKLLMLVAEQLGFIYDKFSAENLNITWNGKGHKLD